MAYAKRWCFTLNNYTDDDLTRVKDFLTPETCVFAIVGKEVGDSGTRHLQGFIHFRARKTFVSVHKALPGAHLEVSKGTDIENQVYCKKGGDVFVEVGVPAHKNEVNSSFVDAYRLADLVADGGDLCELVDSSDELKIAYAKHQRLVDSLIHKRRKKSMEAGYMSYFTEQNFVFYKWQSDLYDELTQTDPHHRKIIWYIDQEGGAGKSTFAAVFIARTASAARYGVVRPADLAFSYNGERVVFFDLARASRDLYSLCGLMEELKNGEIFSGKYESTTKRFRPPHVVVFSNGGPPKGAFSADRLDIRRL